MTALRLSCQKLLHLNAHQKDCICTKKCLTANFPVNFFAGPCQSLQDGEEEVNSVLDFCQEFVEAPIHLQTLVRLSGPAIECPFTGEFTFTYKTGKR